MFDKLIINIKFFIMKQKWKRKNCKNFTYPKNLCDLSKIEIGDYTYGGIDAESYGNINSYLKIGRFCSIAQNVRFVLDGEHNYNKLSTYPFKVRFLGEKVEADCKGPIIIDDDVWIGERTIVLSGVHIGQGAVIAAGSVVVKDVPPYAIYAGTRIVKYRFKDAIIENLLSINYEKMTLEKIKELSEWLYLDVNEDNVDIILEKLDLVNERKC